MQQRHTLHLRMGCMDVNECVHARETVLSQLLSHRVYGPLSIPYQELYKKTQFVTKIICQILGSKYMLNCCKCEIL